MMIGKPVALIPGAQPGPFHRARRSPASGATSIGKIHKLADLNIILARIELDTASRHRGVFPLLGPNAYVDSLESWYDSPHSEKPGSRKE